MEQTPSKICYCLLDSPYFKISTTHWVGFNNKTDLWVCFEFFINWRHHIWIISENQGSYRRSKSIYSGNLSDMQRSGEWLGSIQICFGRESEQVHLWMSSVCRLPSGAFSKGLNTTEGQQGGKCKGKRRCWHAWGWRGQEKKGKANTFSL